MDYESLVSLISNTAENTETSFLDNMPNFVNLTGEKMIRDLDAFGMVVITSLALSAGNSTVSVPSGFRIPKSFTVMVSGRRKQLEWKTIEFLYDYWPDSTSVEASLTPKYYGIEGGNFVIVPTAASTFDIKLAYISSVTALSTVASTNYFTDKASDALFYGSMVEALRYSKNFSDAEAWKQAYGMAIASIVNEERRTRQDDQASNTASAPNALTPGGQ